jgi:hypothetical protein
MHWCTEHVRWCKPEEVDSPLQWPPGRSWLQLAPAGHEMSLMATSCRCAFLACNIRLEPSQAQRVALGACPL